MSRGNLALLVVAALAALMMLIWAQSYAGRVQLRDSQLRGCERGKLDRAGNATGWRTAEAARRRTAHDPTVSRSERRGAAIAAARYARIAAGMEERAAIDCTLVYPHPRLLP
jgi:hypothetical protein